MKFNIVMQFNIVFCILRVPSSHPNPRVSVESKPWKQKFFRSTQFNNLLIEEIIKPSLIEVITAFSRSIFNDHEGATLTEYTFDCLHCYFKFNFPTV